MPPHCPAELRLTQSMDTDAKMTPIAVMFQSFPLPSSLVLGSQIAIGSRNATERLANLRNRPMNRFMRFERPPPLLEIRLHPDSAPVSS